MENEVSKAPTQKQIEEAQAILMQAQQKQQEEQLRRYEPLVNLINSDEFKSILTQLGSETIEDFLKDMQIGPHLMAMRTGMAGLAQRFMIQEIEMQE
jgi:hypothetical protein